MTERLLIVLIRWARNWKFELFLLTLCWYSLSWSEAALGARGGLALWIGGWSALACFPPSRRWMVGRLRLGQVTRRLRRTVARLDWSRLAYRPPTVLAVRPVPAGLQLALRLQVGTSVSDLELARDVLSAAWRARSVEVTRDSEDAGLCFVTIVVRDTLAGAPTPWPVPQGTMVDCWYPIPVGVDEAGYAVLLSLPEHNLLIGGEPGSGKSGALATVLAACSCDPNVNLWLFDGKLVELAAWRDCAHRFVGPDLAEATEALREVQKQMEVRYKLLLHSGQRKVSHGAPLHVVVIDELALYLNHPDRKAAAAFGDLLRDLVARGRAAGVVVVAATQKPSTDVVPSAIRDLFGYRWAMRCSTREASDTILGSGWATAGYSAADIDAAARGVGLLRHEGGAPVRCRSFWLDDDTIRRVAEDGKAFHELPLPVHRDEEAG